MKRFMLYEDFSRPTPIHVLYERLKGLDFLEMGPAHHEGFWFSYREFPIERLLVTPGRAVGGRPFNIMTNPRKKYSTNQPVFDISRMDIEKKMIDDVVLQVTELKDRIPFLFPYFLISVKAGAIEPDIELMRLFRFSEDMGHEQAIGDWASPAFPLLSYVVGVNRGGSVRGINRKSIPMRVYMKGSSKLTVDNLWEFVHSAIGIDPDSFGNISLKDVERVSKITTFNEAKELIDSIARSKRLGI